MSKFSLTGPTTELDDGIIEAEFEEIVVNDELSQAPTPPDYTIREWSRDMHPVKKALGIVGALAVLIPIALYKPDGTVSPPDIINTTGPSTTAEKMLSEWSRYVTGEPKSLLTLTDGDGPPGSDCTEGNPEHLMLFGGRLNASATGGARPDDFTMLFASVGEGIEGRFWWDTQRNVITVREAHAAGIKVKAKAALPDKTFAVSKLRDGWVNLDGVSYHQCQLSDGGRPAR